MIYNFIQVISHSHDFNLSQNATYLKLTPYNLQPTFVIKTYTQCYFISFLPTYQQFYESKNQKARTIFNQLASFIVNDGTSLEVVILLY